MKMHSTVSEDIEFPVGTELCLPQEEGKKGKQNQFCLMLQ